MGCNSLIPNRPGRCGRQFHHTIVEIKGRHRPREAEPMTRRFAAILLML